MKYLGTYPSTLIFEQKSCKSGFIDYDLCVKILQIVINIQLHVLTRNFQVDTLGKLGHLKDEFSSFPGDRNKLGMSE